MNLLYPRMSLRQFGQMTAFGVVGALVAGLYGIAHDQITYSLGPEYFTRFKFEQFDYLNFSRPVRMVVAQIGFLATWWVGFFAAWFMARLTVPRHGLATAARHSTVGVGIMMLTAAAFAVVAAAIAPANLADQRIANWHAMLSVYNVEDSLAFIRVGYIHNASYLGGLIGLIGALVWLRKK